MLSKKNRLTYLQFQRNPHDAHNHFTSALTIAVKTAITNQPRFVVVVPKKLEKRSTLRHKTKRIIVESIRKQIPKMRENLDVLVKPKKILTAKTPHNVSNELKKILT